MKKGWRGHQSDRRWRLRRQRCEHDQIKGSPASSSSPPTPMPRCSTATRRRSAFPLGAELTEPGCGRQAGSRPRCRDGIKDGLQESIRSADMLFITAGMGGGTSTGAASVVAQLAKEMGILVVAVVTKPFRFEMQKANARRRRVSMSCRNVDSLIVVPNESSSGARPQRLALPAAFAASNDVLHGAGRLASRRSSTSAAWSTATSPYAPSCPSLAWR